MKVFLKERLNKNTVSILLLSLFLLSAVAAVTLPIFAIILFPIILAVISAIFIFDSSKSKIYFIFAFVLGLIAILTEYLIFKRLFCCVILSLSLLCAAVNFIAISKGWRKTVCAAVNTVLSVIGLALILWLVAYYITGSFDINSVKEYYGGIFETVKQDFTTLMETNMSTDIYGQQSALISQEGIDYLFKEFYKSLIGFFTVIAFLAVGISYKIISVFIRAFSKNTDDFNNWRFRPSNVFVYFYAIIFLISAFIAGDDVFAVSVKNFYIIFMFVFAYIGFCSLNKFFKARWNNSVLPTVLLIFALFMFSSLAIEILSLFGAFSLLRESGQSSSGISQNQNSKE